MLLDLRSLYEAAEGEHTGTHTGTAAPATASGAGQVTPPVTVFPGVTGGFRKLQEITAEAVAVAATATSRATGSLVFAARGLNRAAPAESDARATQAVSGAAAARGRAATADATAGLGFRARRISAASGQAAASVALAQVRIVGTAAIEAPPATSEAAGTQRTNGLTKNAAPPAVVTSHAGVRANGLQTAAGLPATAGASARIRYPRRFGEARALPPPATAVATGSSIQRITGKAAMLAAPAGAISSARRRFRPDPAALWALGIADDTILEKAS